MKRTNMRRAAVMLCAALTAGMAFTGCEKENGRTIRLNNEKLSGDSKTYVDGTTVGWVDGDLIRFNATTCTVSNGSATDIPMDVALIAFYPSDISNVSDPTATSASVTVPSVYTYTVSDNHQILAMPMVGKADVNDETITMKHICSAWEVTITNGFTDGLVIDSIILRGTGLSGIAAVSNLSNSGDPTVGAGTVNWVLMDFTGNTTTIASNGSLTVQIPVLPVTSGTTWLSLRGHLDNSDGTIYRYRRSTTRALRRATVHAAPVTMSVNQYTQEVVAPPIPEGALPGVFTVNGNGLRVYFSKGNLQYTFGSTVASNDGIWKFAEHQYDVIGGNSPNARSGTAYPTGTTGNNTPASGRTIDLFGWGANNQNSIWASTQTNDNSDYAYPGEARDLLPDQDWGYNPISNGGPGRWRTLTGPEWNYLLSGRSGSNYAKVNIGGNKCGLVIFPDGYSPSTSIIPNDKRNNTTTDFYTISAANWTILENAGCVFLPAAGSNWRGEIGRLGNRGYYCSSSASGATGMIGIWFDWASFTFPRENCPRYDGTSVRLVHNI